MTELLSCRCELEAGLRRDRLRRLFGLTVPDRRRSGSVAVWEHRGTIDLPPAASRLAASLRSAAIREADFTTLRPDLLLSGNIQGHRERDPLTGLVIGAAIEVHRALGPGLLEDAYEQCLCHELSLRNVEFRHQDRCR